MYVIEINIMLKHVTNSSINLNSRIFVYLLTYIFNFEHNKGKKKEIKLDKRVSHSNFVIIVFKKSILEFSLQFVPNKMHNDA